MKTLQNISFLIIGMVLIAVPLFFYFYLVNEISLLYYGKMNGLLYETVKLFYPRFWVESQRFNLSFFIAHAEQVIWRFELVSIVAIASYYFCSKYNNIKEQLNQFWQIDYSEINAKIYNFVTYGSILYYFNDYNKDYKFWLNYKDLYEPILLFKILHIPLWSNEVVMVLFAIFVIGCIASMMSIFLKINSIIVALLFILFQGWSYSFGKINHGYALLTYIVIILAVQSFCNNVHKKTFLQLIRITIASCYLMAGLEKLFISQFSWISPITFRAYLLQHPTKIGLWIVQYKSFCTILPAAALAIQLGFVLILFKPKWKNAILISGVLFHIGTVALFGISSYFHPWAVTYVFFVDWKSIILKTRPFKNKLAAKQQI